MASRTFKKPMSAKQYDGNEDSVQYPCYMQPKLDGVRCVTDGRTFWSRNGKKFPAKNLTHLQVRAKFPWLVDGELFIERAPFEDIISAIKNASTKDRRLAKSLRFCVFDVMTPQAFSVRTIEVESTVKHAKMAGAKWRKVPTYYIRTRQHLDGMTEELVKRHEGVMVRSGSNPYEHKRTKQLLKRKPMLDGEFEICAVKEAKGKDRGTPIFICTTVNGQRFRVRPMGTYNQRHRMWRRRARLIGCMLTVEYQNLTKHGKPRFPRAKVLRDYE